MKRMLDFIEQYFGLGTRNAPIDRWWQEKRGQNAAAEKLAEAKELLEHTLAVLEHCEISSGYCMCGSRVEDHDIGSGHSPVDEGSHYSCELQRAIQRFIKEE